MAIGIITGSGRTRCRASRAASPSRSRRRGVRRSSRAAGSAGVDVAHVSRHGAGHVRLSNHVAHRANIAALAQLGVDGVLAVTVCGAVDPAVQLGSLICFDDLHFPPTACPTARCARSTPRRGTRGAGTGSTRTRSRRRCAPRCSPRPTRPGSPMRDGGCYGHVDGPRFNTKAEIRGLAAAGVTAVSQTAGPETVLAGEAELPFALVGYATDYANGVQAEATPVARLLELIAASTDTFARLLAAALPRIDGAALAPAGVVYRFHEA